MATTMHAQRQFEMRFSHSKLAQWSVPLGRFFFGLIFVLSGLNHFSSESIGYAQSMGVAMANLLVPVSGVLCLLGGLSVILGYKVKWGALLLILFLVPTTIIMHAFWNQADPQMAHFMKNLSLIGGALLIIYYGSGPLSLDSRKITT